MCDFGNPPKKPTTIYEDNQSAIAMSHNPQFHGCAKHIDIKHLHSRGKNINLEYCPTREMAADIFTKGLAREQFCTLRSKTGIVPPEH